MSYCPKCKSGWKDCYCKSWQTKDFIFARPQIFWILRAGLVWPTSKDCSDEPIKGKKLQCAPYESTSCIIAEIDFRVKTCKELGQKLLTECEHVEYIQELTYNYRGILNYISGIWRRDVCYWVWASEIYKKIQKEELLAKIKPCECGHNRWRTISKYEAWACRKCGKVRGLTNLVKGEYTKNSVALEV